MMSDDVLLYKPFAILLYFYSFFLYACTEQCAGLSFLAYSFVD